jgi:hypothetical protein
MRGWRGNPAFSFFMNVPWMSAICFEQMIVATVQEAKPLAERVG